MRWVSHEFEREFVLLVAELPIEEADGGLADFELQVVHCLVRRRVAGCHELDAVVGAVGHQVFGDVGGGVVHVSAGVPEIVVPRNQVPRVVGDDSVDEVVLFRGECQ